MILCHGLSNLVIQKGLFFMAMEKSQCFRVALIDYEHIFQALIDYVHTFQEI